MLTYNEEYFLLSQYVNSKDGDSQPNVHIFSSAADNCAEANLWIFRFRWDFYNKAQEEGECRNQIWLLVLLKLSSVIVGHSLALKYTINLFHLEMEIIISLYLTGEEWKCFEIVLYVLHGKHIITVEWLHFIWLMLGTDAQENGSV